MGSRRDPKAPWRPCQRRYGVESLLGAGTYFFGGGGVETICCHFYGEGDSIWAGMPSRGFFWRRGGWRDPRRGPGWGGGRHRGGARFPWRQRHLVSYRTGAIFPKLGFQTPGGSDLFATGWLLKICCFLLFFIFFSYLFFPLPASGAPKVNVSFIASSDLVS